MPKKMTYLSRFAAAKLAEGDMLILDRLHLDQNEKETLEHIIQQMERREVLTARQPLQICDLLYQQGMQADSH